jgi:hypothetical protein
MIETVAAALACLGTIVTGFSTAWLWVEHCRLERRIAKLEARVRSEETGKLWGKIDWERHDARSLSKGEAADPLRSSMGYEEPATVRPIP